MTKQIDIKNVIEQIREEIISGLIKYKNKGIKPKCAFIRVGDDEFSKRYVSLKEKACEVVGIEYVDIHFPKEIEISELFNKIIELNNDNSINGILVQMPLPEPKYEISVRNLILPVKDVDGIGSENILRGAYNSEFNLGCLPATIKYILEKIGFKAENKTMLICGKEDVMSLPCLNYFSNICKNIVYTDSDSNLLEHFVNLSDIVVSCCNKPQFIKSEWLKEDSVFFDVGNSSIPDASKKSGYRLVGDLDYDEKKCKAAFVTPVPGGMGPATIAILTLNIYESFIAQNKKM